MYCYRSCYCCCCCSCYCQGLALSCVCAPMVSRSHVFILSSSHALMLSFSRAIMMLSVCRLYRKYRRIIVRNQNASPSTSPTSARSAQVRPSHDVMLSRLRALEPSNRHRPRQRLVDGRGRLGGRGVTGGGERRCGRCRRDGDLDLEFHPNPLLVLLNSFSSF